MVDNIELAQAEAPRDEIFTEDRVPPSTAQIEQVLPEHLVPGENTQPFQGPAEPQRVHLRNQSHAHRTSPTPQDYVRAIRHHAIQDASTPELRQLAQLLSQPPVHTRPPVSDRSSFATIYILGQSRDLSPVSLESPSQLAELLQEATPQDNSQGCMLFLSGYPSPEWLTTIGAQCRVDPECFRRHMKFLSSSYDRFTYPSLPSASKNIITLTVTTIGVFSPVSKTSQSAVDSLRLRALESSREYAHKLTQGRETQIGDSIFKRYSVHDEEYFSVEQEISISLNYVDGRWLLLIWLDAGDDSATSRWLPEPDWKTSYLPITTQRQKIAIKRPVHGPPTSTSRLRAPAMSRSTLFLRDSYGRFLKPEIMALDPFYALNELFSFAATSELQFLNLVESKLDLETGHAVLLQPSPSLSNLLYHQELLQSHIRRIRENIETIQLQGGAEWPGRSNQTPQQLQKANEAANILLRDFEYLLSKAEDLRERCDRGKSVIMNNANLAESKRMGKLTFLAFFYVPLSFTTSFFGMNFQQFGTSTTLSFWIWPVVSVPILVLSVVLYVYDINGFCENGLRRLRGRFRMR